MEGQLVGETTPAPYLQALTPGTYEIELAVTDTKGASGYDSVVVTLVNDAPEPAATVSVTRPAVMEEIQLSAVETVDPNGQPLTYKWIVDSAPVGAALPPEFEGIVWSGAFDAPGEYNLSLSVSDGYATARIALPPIVVTDFSVQKLPSGIGRTAVQPGGDRVVIASHGRIMIFDEGEPMRTVAVSEYYLDVAVSPDGRIAALASPQKLTLMDLETGEALSNLVIETRTRGLVVTNRGDVYMFNPDTTTDLWSIDMVSGQVTRIAGRSDDIRPVMHPSGRKIYAFVSGVPNEVGRYLADHGDLYNYIPSAITANLCGSGWIAPDGASMLTYCGTVLRLDDDPARDMTYLGQISEYGGAIQSASYSAVTNCWYVLGPPNEALGSKIQIFDAATFVKIGEIGLPPENGLDGPSLVATSVVVSEEDGTIRIWAKDHLTTDKDYYLLVTKGPIPVRPNKAPEIVLQSYSAGYVNERVRLTASQSYDPEGDSLTFDWRLVEQPSLSALPPITWNAPDFYFMPAAAGEYVFEVTASDGARTSAPKQISVSISDNRDEAFYRIEGNVLDADISRFMGKFVYIREGEAALHIVDLLNFTETSLPLDRPANRLALSPDGQKVALSHPGLVTLVGMPGATQPKTIPLSWDWGEILIDKSLVAHVIPDRGEIVPLISLDFTTGTERRFWNVPAGSRMGQQDTSNSIYAVTARLASPYVAKWSAKTLPLAFLGDSRALGDFEIGTNLWFSKTGDEYMTSSGELFYASTNPAVDMTLRDRLPDGARARWAVHTSNTGEWMVAVDSAWGMPELAGAVAIYDQSDLSLKGIIKSEGLTSEGARADANPLRVFYSDNGLVRYIFSEMDEEGLYTLQVSATH